MASSRARAYHPAPASPSESSFPRLTIGPGVRPRQRALETRRSRRGPHRGRSDRGMTAMPDQPTAFNARALHALKSDLLYRVYARPGGLYFIRIGGQGLGGGVAGGLGAFGLIGALLGGLFETLLKKQNAKRLMAKQSELDANDPRSL